MQKFTLEKYRVFPYVAWSLIIGFAVFVGSVTLELRHTISELEVITQNLQTSVPPHTHTP
ncbi:MAG: hypothetical protein V4668_02860 [Patescibacteria group bacterium]